MLRAVGHVREHHLVCRVANAGRREGGVRAAPPSASSWQGSREPYSVWLRCTRPRRDVHVIRRSRHSWENHSALSFGVRSSVS